jgi:hypothetical protein
VFRCCCTPKYTRLVIDCRVSMGFKGSIKIKIQANCDMICVEMVLLSRWVAWSLESVIPLWTIKKKKGGEQPEGMK